KRLEVARALAGAPRLLLLDEPVAGLGGAEVDEMAALVRQLVAEGQTILLIEHNVVFVMGLCDRLAVLNFGRKIAEGTPSEIAADPAVVEAYLGRDEGARRRPAPAWASRAWSWPAAASGRSTGSVCASARARSSRSSARTAPARARPWPRSPAWSGRVPARSAGTAGSCPACRRTASSRPGSYRCRRAARSWPG